MQDSAALLERAKADTGLEQFGEETFLEGLDRLLSSARTEARLTQLGEAVFEGNVLSLLKQRLQIEDCIARNPEIEQEEIVAPLFGLGLPRTGSTAFSCMLAEDPAIRVMRNWEQMQVCPPPERATYDNDPRIQLAEEAMRVRNERFPRMKQMVPSTATSPVECQNLMGMDFRSQIFQAMFRLPSYVRWLHHEADLKSTFRWVKRVLKLLQWHCPPTRWRLKNPSHILFIDDLDAVFPDARFWASHRDVADVIPSGSDLYFELHKAFTEEVDKRWIGEINVEFCELGMQRVLAFRDRGNDDRFFDFRFADFQRDPWPVIEDLYRWLDEPLTDEARARMAAWRESTPRDKHGAHDYDPAEFGLDRDALRNAFRFYHQRFGLETKGQ
jgi:hypothetical protein